ncbi:MAG TPA: tripartite tricarboxylate transporter permease [Candidatus Nanoarchaeia archaeon]|nr:tripartite tricarboxylate transporter permease [Candidatus Nanoarchaeia archaeon]
MWELVLALLLGVVIGTLTGLAPGIHVNLIAAFLVASLDKFHSVPAIALVSFIASLSITHIVVDFIPSIFLGAPEEDSFLAILPGHQMLREGHGFSAVVYACYGALIAVPVLVLATPLYIYFLPSLYPLLKTALPFILIFISCYLILREERPVISFLIFSLAGLLGLLTFNLPVKEPLMPLLTGLFGISSLLVASKNKEKIKKQTIVPIRKIYLSRKELIRTFSAASIAAPLCSFLPGIGSGHAAVIGSEIVPQNNRSFLALIGAINIIVMSLSFVTVFAISRARSGSAAAMQDILGTITLQHIIITLMVIIFSALFSIIISIYLARRASTLLNKVNYSILSKSIIAVLVLLVILFSNWLGFIVALTASSIGILCISLNVRRINLMASLILPAIVFYLLH